MKINFTKQLKNLDGKPAFERDEEGKKINVTLADVCSSALLQGGEQETMEWSDKLKRYELALKINQSKGVIEIPIEDLDMIKKSLAVMPILYCGQAVKMIEGNG